MVSCFSDVVAHIGFMVAAGSLPEGSLYIGKVIRASQGGPENGQSLTFRAGWVHGETGKVL